MPRLYLRVLSPAQPLSLEGGDDDEGYALDVEWLIKEDGGAVRGTGVTDYRGLAEVADSNLEWLQNPLNTVVFLPSQFVLSVECNVPGRNAAQIRRALPFAAEEFVASDIESMHIAHAAIKPGHPVTCNILPHELMSNWLGCFNAIDIHPGYFVVDAQVLPGEDNSASVLFEGGTTLVSSGNQTATVDRGNLLFALNSLGCDRIYTINGELDELERGQLDNAPEIEALTVSEYGVLDFLAEQFAADKSINLLQGEYQAKRPSSPNAGRWRTVAALAAAWFVIAFFGMLIQAWWADREADQLTEESFAFYKSLFPRESQPVGLDQLRRRMAAKLGQKDDQAEASAFIGLTAHFANVISADNQVESLSYTDQREELTVEVMLNSYDDLDTIKQKLSGAGVAVEVASAEEEGSKVRSRMRVRYGK